MNKPFYPAKFFRFRLRYGERYCRHAECGKRLVPYLKGDKLELVQNFNVRKYCGPACMKQARAAATAERRGVERARTAKLLNRIERTKPERRRKTGPPSEAVQDALEEAGGLVERETPEIRPPDPPADISESRGEEPSRAPPASVERSSDGEAPMLPQAAPLPPQGLPFDPRPERFTVSEGKVLERLDNGICANEGCGRPLNAFGVCGHCRTRERYQAGQRALRGGAFGRQE